MQYGVVLASRSTVNVPLDTVYISHSSHTNHIERYNEVERSQHITQADTRVYGQSYLANTSSVSEKDAFLEDTANHDHVHFSQSLSKFRKPGVPQRLPAEHEVEIEQDPRLTQLIAHLHELRGVNAEPQELKIRGKCGRDVSQEDKGELFERVSNTMSRVEHDEQ
jgi:hypothetical protein